MRVGPCRPVFAAWSRRATKAPAGGPAASGAASSGPPPHALGAGRETSLENLVLLCSHHHRLVHEGGYTIEDDPSGGVRFRNRYGVLCPSVPRSPPGSVGELVELNGRRGTEIGAGTNRNGSGDALDVELAVAVVRQAVG